MNLVSTDWLEEHLNDDNLLIVDIRGEIYNITAPEPRFLSHYQNYTQSHIPGAVFLNWIEEITDDANHMMVAEPGKFGRAMSRIGLNRGDQFVVVYDGIDGSLAARFWWALRFNGHHRVAMLDGGWDKWNDSEKRLVTDEMPSFTASNFVPDLDLSLRCTGQQVLEALNGSTVLLDTRPEDEFMGEASMARQYGHIPGAINLPVEYLVSEDNALHSPDKLRQIFADVGIDDATSGVIAYGNIGVSPCLALLALEAADLPRGALYDGSWQEWGNDPKKPVER